MKISIYEHSRAIDFVLAYYQSNKEKNATSLRDWANEMGFDSPLILIDLLKKKRPIKLKYVPYLSLGLKLNSNEQLYFQTLLMAEKASGEEKNYYEKLLIHFRPKNVDPNQDTFAHWLNVAILTIARIENFPLNPTSIQSTLSEFASLNDIKNSLALLIKKGHLTEENGKLRRTHEAIVTSANDVSVDSTKNYYTQVLRKAENALTLPVLEREFQCFSLSVTQADLPRIKQILRQARQELSALNNPQGNEIMQLNLMGFPIAKIEAQNRPLTIDA